MSKKQKIIYSKEKKYLDREHLQTTDFSSFIRAKRKQLNQKMEQKISTKDIAEMLDVSYELLRKYINEEKKTKHRDCVIAICAILALGIDETNKALAIYGMDELDATNPRDDELMDILETQEDIILHAEEELTKDQLLSIETINEKLKSFDLTELKIIEHRNNVPKLIQYPYPIISKMVECRVDELFWGDQYDSLSTQYDKDYRIYASMYLRESKGKVYELCAEANGSLWCIEHTMEDERSHKYNSIDDTGEFHDCFVELLQMAYAERKRIANIQNDTRNYHERISARIIDNVLHVFYETFNYEVPELNEYYLMDYVDGKYTLYVYSESQFMRYYLSKEEYKKLFGKLPKKELAKYTSVDDINQERKKDFIWFRTKIFKQAQEKINSIISELVSEKVYIKNFDAVFENPYEVIEFYKACNEFKCSYDDEHGEICNIGADIVMFDMPDNKKVELTIDDLCNGYKLGLSTINEIGLFLLEHKTFDLSDLFHLGLESPK